MKRIFSGSSYANVTATVALIVALGGTSYAAIKLPKNSVTSATVKDRSLLKKDFKLGQLPAGKQGPPGPAGPAGGSGAAGGAAGGQVVVNRVDALELLVPGSAPQTIQTMNLGPGSWAVTARFVAENGGPDGYLTCSLNLAGAVIDSLGPAPGLPLGPRQGVDFGTGDSSNVLVGAGTLPSGGVATVVCATDNGISAGSYRARSMVAVKAASADVG